MDRSIARSSSPDAPIPMSGGAAVVSAGSFFPCFAVRTDFSPFGGPGPRDTIVSGFDTSDGKLLLAVAMGIAVLEFAVLVLHDRGARIAGSVVAVFEGLFFGGVAIYELVRPEARAVEEFSHELTSVPDIVAASARAVPPDGSTWEASRGASERSQSPPSVAPIGSSERMVTSAERPRAPIGDDADRPPAS
jgi:hypothetical protein